MYCSIPFAWFKHVIYARAEFVVSHISYFSIIFISHTAVGLKSSLFSLSCANIVFFTCTIFSSIIKITLAFVKTISAQIALTVQIVQMM